MSSAATPKTARGPKTGRQAPAASSRGDSGEEPRTDGLRWVVAGGGSPEALMEKEWLLTDGLGGFAMGTALGANSRRYHGLLVAATAPPVGRVVALSNVVDDLTMAPGTGAERKASLATFRFGPGPVTTSPDGWTRLARFEQDETCRWVFDVDGVQVVREVGLLRDGGGAVVVWRFGACDRAIRLTATPLAAMRDFHGALRRGDGREFWVDWPRTQGAARASVWSAGMRLDLACEGGWFEWGPDWWMNFDHERERERGQDDVEDLFAPGRFVFEIPPGRNERAIGLTARLLAGEAAKTPPSDAPAEAVRAVERDAAARRTRRAAQVEAAVKASPALAHVKEAEALVAAADQFIVRRTVDMRPSWTVIAGHPWFSDWGRDALISTPGLLLATGRFEEARAALETFARNVKNGLVPNLFDDRTGAAHYNTVDASLWFLHAACAYLEASGDRKGFDSALKPACFEIVRSYAEGTDFGICVDPADGLVTAGDANSQLTWMDAKRDGVAFTPRHGKAVEINALWAHGLAALRKAVEGKEKAKARELGAMWDAAAKTFEKTFWNAKASCLHDCVTPRALSAGGGGAGGKGGWEADASIRPNQIFAVSLDDVPLSEPKRRAVVACVRERLVTPFGLRTLDPADSRFRGRFEGDMWSRDSAYHYGTVWPWLLGAYVEALLKVNGFSEAAKREARDAMAPLLRSLGEGCLGQVAEVYDGAGDASRPQKAGGCVAQAWSVAELLRAAALIGG